MAIVTRFCKKLTDKDRNKALGMLRERLSDKEITDMYPELFKSESNNEVKSVCNRSEGYKRVII